METSRSCAQVCRQAGPALTSGPFCVRSQRSSHRGMGVWGGAWGHQAAGGWLALDQASQVSRDPAAL